MNKLTNVFTTPLQGNKYLKPLTMVYTQNNVKKSWDLMTVHQSVGIIIFNSSRKTLLFVKQFRPPVFYDNIAANEREGVVDVVKYPAELGITLELCAGIVDKDLPLETIAAEEVLEECGYKVNPGRMEKVSSFPSSVGVTGSTMNIFYCEVTDDMKVSHGGGIHDELIEVVEMTVSDVRDYISQPKVNSPPSCLFGVQWYLLNKV